MIEKHFLNRSNIVSWSAPMKKAFLLLLLFLPTLMFARNDEKINQLEKDLDGLKGKRYAKQCVKLSKLYFDDMNYGKAYEVAKMGYEEARKNNMADYQGICLNQAARVMIDKEPTNLNDLERAKQDLIKSKDILKDTDLNKIQMDNNNLMKRLERRQQSILNPDQEKSGIEEIKEGISSMFNRNKSTESVRERNSGNREYAEIDKDFLLQQLATQKRAIAQMSSDQLQQQYLLLEQGRLLDSMNLASFLDSLEIDNQEFELRSKEVELKEQKAQVQLEKNKKRAFIGLFGMIIIVALGLLYLFFNTKKFNRTLQVKNEQIQHEKQKADNLLLNILPADIAKELKEHGKSEAQYFTDATIVFTDFKDFTKTAERLNPTELVEELNICFKAFDAIVSKYEVEKIKTIGDAYMAVGGLNNDKHSAKNVILAALEMQEFILNRRSEDPNSFEMRVGIHSGPLVAGIVGDKKFQYDIWGDSVNTAARMESSGKEGKVNISATTYEKVKNSSNLKFEARGAIAAKNKGDIEMYFVSRA